MYTMAWPMAHGERRATASKRVWNIAEVPSRRLCVRLGKVTLLHRSRDSTQLHLGTDAPAGELADRCVPYVTEHTKK